MYPVENLSPVRDQAAGHRQHDGHATVMQKTSACVFGLAGQWQVISLKRAGVVLALCKHVRNRCKRPVGAADFTPTIALSFASLRGCFDPPPGRFFRRRRSQVQQAVAGRSNEFANRAVYDSKIGNLGRDSVRTLVGRKAAGNVTLHCDSLEVIQDMESTAIRLASGEGFESASGVQSSRFLEGKPRSRPPRRSIVWR
ncbi:hypothetical protein SV7mr_41300 [Stieleria bergensis]|uniref:Uncharacterized protein n=1 Tax=Stieleria bergensis TaxID=2528025 RepID=A0A517SZV0_9BACT|nr:hypothetical protein SV7mr_41300 [Planctomycetes bacterium SV_7m_r]